MRDEDTFDTWFSSSHWPIVCTNWLAGKGESVLSVECDGDGRGYLVCVGGTDDYDGGLCDG